MTLVLGLAPLVFMFFTFLLCRPSRVNFDRIHVAVVLLIALFALVALLRGSTVAGRIYVGTTYDPNDLSAMLAIGIPLAFGLIVRNGGVRRILVIGASVLMVVVDIKTESRGGIIALLAGCVVFAMGQRPSRWIMLAGILVMSGAAGWTLADDEFKERMLSVLHIESDYNMTASTGRLEVWKRGLGYAADSPIYGMGAGNFHVADGEWLKSQGATGKWSASHNAYLQALVDLGAVGFLLYMGILGSFGRRAFGFWHQRAPPGVPRRPELLAALAGFCVSAMFLSLAYSYMLLCLLGLIALADRTWPKPRPVGRPRGPHRRTANSRGRGGSLV